MHNDIVLSLLTGSRTEELRALTWDHVLLSEQTDETPVPSYYIEVWRSVRTSGDTKTRRSRRTLALPARCVEALHINGSKWSQIESGLVHDGKNTDWSSQFAWNPHERCERPP